MELKVTRKTTETVMTVILNDNPIATDYRKRLKTSIPFFNHMLEHIVWRSGLNLDISIEMDEFYLTHALCEDLGITVGKAVGEYINRNTESGVCGYGCSTGIIDEAKAEAAVSFESRVYFDLNTAVPVPDMVEGMASEDLATFLEGFAQGACCTLHIDVPKGVNGHHIWEAIFRAFGMALKAAVTPDPSRANKTAGVAGHVIFTIE